MQTHILSECLLILTEYLAAADRRNKGYEIPLNREIIKDAQDLSEKIRAKISEF